MKIQTSEIEELQKRWHGGTCDHPELAKEYTRSIATGDYACLTCGRCEWGRDWPRKEREKNK